jgi:multidrug resistance protein
MQKLDKKIFATLFFSIFATVTGVGIVVPLLPVYAHDLGASGLYIGLIFGAFSLSRTFFLPFFGRLSDKKGRKPFIVPGLFAYALISVAFIYSQDVTTLIIIRFFHGVASAMLMPVIQAYVGDITPNGREGFTMGLFNMSLFLGLSLGPLIGGLIKDQLNLQASFICMGLLALLGFVLCLLLLPPTKSERVIGIHKDPMPWSGLLFDRSLAGLFIFRFAYVVCIGIIWGFIPVYADSEFSLSSSAIGILIMLGVFISGSIHVPMGYLADWLNKKLLVVTGALIVGYAILSFEWANNYHDMVLATIIFGLGGGISMPALMAMAVLKGSKSNAMGSVMALMTVAHSLGMLTGALLGGIMMDLFQLRFAFPTGALVMTIGAGLFLISTRTKERPL